jgi:hypothetical protein
MFEDLKERIAQLKEVSNPIITAELNQYLLDIGKYEQIKELREVKFVKDVLDKFSYEIASIDQHLLNDSVDDYKSIAQRKLYEGAKKAYNDLLIQFSLPNIDYIAEELKNYE